MAVVLVCWHCGPAWYPLDHDPACPLCGKPLVRCRFVLARLA